MDSTFADPTLDKSFVDADLQVVLKEACGCGVTVLKVYLNCLDRSLVSRSLIDLLK